MGLNLDSRLGGQVFRSFLCLMVEFLQLDDWRPVDPGNTILNVRLSLEKERIGQSGSLCLPELEVVKVTYSARALRAEPDTLLREPARTWSKSVNSGLSQDTGVS